MIDLFNSCSEKARSPPLDSIGGARFLLILSCNVFCQVNIIQIFFDLKKLTYNNFHRIFRHYIFYYVVNNPVNCYPLIYLQFTAMSVFVGIHNRIKYIPNLKSQQVSFYWTNNE